MYGDPIIVKVKSLRGKVHEYLSNNLDYNTKGEVKMDIIKYVENIIDEFSVNIDKAQSLTGP